MMDTERNLRHFERLVGEVKTNEQSELFVRGIMKEVARTCPKEVLVALATCTIELRRAELEKEVQGR